MDRNVKLYQKLENLFLNINLNIWESLENEFINSEPVKKLSSLFPKWYFLLESAKKTDKDETIRTLRHTLHTLQVYFSIKNNEFEKNVDKQKLKSLRTHLDDFYEFDPLYFLLILLYHDIGRPFNRTWHTVKSEEIISRLNLLEEYNLPKYTEKLILIAIKHHLLVGTIFTGESSYFGSFVLYSELRNGEKNMSNQQIQLLFRTMKCFTLIDIWGYDYAKIYDHYFSYYNEICGNLIEIFQESLSYQDKTSQKEYLQQALFRLDTQHLKWRIACSLRIFQFITVKPHLTKEFYISKVEDGLAHIGSSWDEFQQTLKKNHPRIQFKYALPLMMILSTKEFSRAPIDNSFEMQSEIFSFWRKCTEIVERKISNISDSRFSLFYFVFDFPRHWFFKSEYRNKIRTYLIDALSNAKSYFNETLSGHIITISLKDINQEV